MPVPKQLSFPVAKPLLEVIYTQMVHSHYGQNDGVIIRMTVAFVGIYADAV